METEHSVSDSKAQPFPHPCPQGAQGWQCPTPHWPGHSGAPLQALGCLQPPLWTLWKAEHVGDAGPHGSGWAEQVKGQQVVRAGA